MQCPYCDETDSSVVETRFNRGENVTRRRRECNSCGERFTTYERVETPSLTVEKRDGSTEPFDREKLREGIERACEKRPVDGETIDRIVNTVAAAVTEAGSDTVASSTIGDHVIEELKQVDEVAYMRYASVYNAFDDLSSFEEEVQTLRTDS